MIKNKTKRAIYLRTFSALFAIYLVLMAGFSILLIMQEKKVKGMELGEFAYFVNNTVEEVLRNNFDRNNRIADVAKVKRDFVEKSYTFFSPKTELAIYSGDYDLIFHTNDYWLCQYTKYSEGEKNYTGYACLNPKDWFDKNEVKELEKYLRARPKAEKPGDLDGYSIEIEGFWLDNEMIIPDKIYVVPMYASRFDEEGNVASSGGTRRDDMVYITDYQNTKGLPYYKYGSILPTEKSEADENQIALRNMVLDKKKLRDAAKQPWDFPPERVNLTTYRYYLIMPFQNSINITEDQNHYSESWTVIAREVNLLHECAGTVAFVWASCFVTFLAAALILSSQTYKTYQQREELERHRKETTNALAHDLKTPLSIISGYAQNLIENVQTEKREHYAAGIQSNVERMDKIIREMLELSKLEFEGFQIKFEEISLSELCTDLMNRYSLFCEEKSITVCLEGDAVIKAEYSLMERVIDNFFTNALDYTPDGGTIRIGISDSILEFYNSGSRIPKEKVDEIWKPYKKADESRGNTKGTGLGLSITSTILELYQFSYGAENREDGVMFWFKFA